MTAMDLFILSLLASPLTTFHLAGFFERFSRSMMLTARCLPKPFERYTFGALIIRIGFWGPLYYKYNKDPPK